MVARRKPAGGPGDDEEIPFLEEIVANARRPKLLVMYRKMRLIEDGGFPPHGVRYEPADKRQPPIYRLKLGRVKWRPYFYESRSEKRLIYLHLVFKTDDKSDPLDAQRARRRLAEYLAGQWHLRPFEFPDP